MVRVWPLAVPFVAVAVSAAAAVQGAAPTRLYWQKDWKVACDLAAAEGKRLLVCVMNEKEEACGRMLDKVYADATVKLKLANFVLVPCSVSTHDVATIDLDGQRVQTCPRFPGILCSDHQALERELHDRFADAVTKEIIVPHHAVLETDGTLVTSRPYEMKRDGFLEFLNGSLAAGKGAAATGSARSPAVQKIVEAIVRAKSEDDREQAARELFADVSPEREEAFLEVIGRLKREEDQSVVIRAAGRPEMRAWAPTIVQMLDAKQAGTRNCTVVSLEEEANPVVAPQLLALWEKEKDAEVRKDLLRALGPCGNKDPKARQILLAELPSQKDGHRIAAALSLGHFLAGDAEVAAAYEARWKKEREHKVKLAMLWGIGMSAEPAQAELVDRLMKDERNEDLGTVADHVARRLRDGASVVGPAPGSPGAPGGGAGGAGASGGSGWRVLRLLAPIYSDDKVIRNVARDFGRRGGGR